MVDWRFILVSAGVALVLCAGGFAGGYFYGRYKTPPKTITVESPGEVIYRDKVVYNTNANCCEQLSVIGQEFSAFMQASPIVDETTREYIQFRIYKNKYRLRYGLNDVPQWHIAPIIAGRATFSPMSVSLGAGVMADYASIGGGVIVNGLFPTSNIDVTAFGYWRF